MSVNQSRVCVKQSVVVSGQKPKGNLVGKKVYEYHKSQAKLVATIADFHAWCEEYAELLKVLAGICDWAEYALGELCNGFLSGELFVGISQCVSDVGYQLDQLFEFLAEGERLVRKIRSLCRSIADKRSYVDGLHAGSSAAAGHAFATDMYDQQFHAMAFWTQYMCDQRIMLEQLDAWLAAGQLPLFLRGLIAQVYVPIPDSVFLEVPVFSAVDPKVETWGFRVPKSGSAKPIDTQQPKIAGVVGVGKC